MSVTVRRKGCQARCALSSGTRPLTRAWGLGGRLWGGSAVRARGRGGSATGGGWRGFGAINGEGFGPIDRVFDPQEGGEFVVGFLAVEAGSMFEADPFVAADQIGGPLALAASIHLAGRQRHAVAEQAHEVRTLAGRETVQD